MKSNEKISSIKLIGIKIIIILIFYGFGVFLSKIVIKF
ncbi:hypothetical protein UMC2_34911 [[Clostridium] sordellii]|nr:hypothetical protein UMC2_34911 [[Clostridium] sordellii] [Paeniclostridium sordellii]